jgi:hypothetical protein
MKELTLNLHAAAGALAAWAFTNLAVAMDVPQTVRIEITLEEAAFRPAAPAELKPFSIRINRIHGALDKVAWGSARSFHDSDFPGRLQESAITPDRLRVAATFRELAYAWAPPGDWCRFDVDCAPDGHGGFSGRWKGMYRGREGEGAARASLVPLRERPGWTAPAPGEHPRFLFRLSDLPALKAKAATPWGQAEIARLRKILAGSGGPDTEGPTGRAIVLGLLYHLTGDKALADQGREILLRDVRNWYNVMYVHGAAACVSQGALAYDLLYPTADAEWRTKMQAVFRAKLDYLYFPPVGGFNNKDGSNWSAMYRSSLGMAALAILSEPSTTTVRIPAGEIAVFPAQKTPAADGAVVAPLVPDRAIGAWLHAGPFLVESTKEVIGAAGGPSARPVAGASVEYVTKTGEKATCTFAPLPTNCLIGAEWAEKYRKPEIEGGVNFAAASKRKFLTTQLLSTVLELKEGGVFRWDHSMTKIDRLNAWLDGKPLYNGDIVRMESGQHHLMLDVAIGVCGGHEIIESHARFRPLAETAAAEWLAKSRRERAHAEAVARIDTADGADTRARDWYAAAQQCVGGWVERALGDNGWNSEGEAYTQHALRQVLVFSHAMRNVTGRDLAPGRALPAIFPQYVAKTIFRRDGVTMPSNGPGGGPLGVDNWARGFGIVEDRYREVCLAAWDRTQAMAEEGTFASPYVLVSDLDACSAAFRFVNHPGAPAPDVDPATVLSRTMVDAEKSGFLFRDGWRGDDDCVVSILSEPRDPGQSWGNADQGDLRWSALGCEWAERGIPAGNGINLRGPDKNGVYPHMRQFGSVIQIPGCKVSERDTPGPKEGRCRLLSSDLTKDGSGVVTMDLSGYYVGVTDEEFTAPNGTKGVRKVAKDLGIRAIRSIAVDHTGTSGSPSLVAVADKLTGTNGDETWQFCTPAEHKIAIDGQTFTIAAANGATLRGTVVAPTGAVVTSEDARFTHEINYHARHEQVELKRQIVKVRGAGSFFLVVMTVQRGEAPAVAGDAANGAAKIGRRTIRFTGGRLLLE